MRVQALVASMLRTKRHRSRRPRQHPLHGHRRLVSMFPATAARALGLGDVPLICARELAVDRCHGALRPGPHALLHRAPREELHHVYLEGARGLRDDLPE